MQNVRILYYAELFKAGVFINSLEELWQTCILNLSTAWSSLPVDNAPKLYYDSGSTTQSCRQDAVASTIVPLSASFSATTMLPDFIPVATRNIAMFRSNRLWLFASSWLSAAKDTATFSNFVNLDNKSLGDLLFFDQAWQRSELSFSHNTQYFARRSFFYGANSETILLLEIFLKDDGALSCYELTKQEKVHE